MSNVKAPRVKKWSEDETLALLQAVQPIYVQLFNNETSEQYKGDLWQQVTNKVNSVRGDVVRTADKVKEKWGYLKSDAKKAFTAYNVSRRLTGGGAAPPSPPAKFKLMRDIVPCEVFEGLEGGCER